MGRLYLRQLREEARPVVARVSGADGDGPGGLPLRQADLALVLSLAGEGELEAVHGRFPGVLPCAGATREPVADGLFKGRRRGRFRGPALPSGRAAPGGDPGGWAGRGEARGEAKADRGHLPEWAVRALGEAGFGRHAGGPES